MKGEHANAGGQESSPEDGCAVEGGSLLDGEQQAPYGRCKGCCHPYSVQRKGCGKSCVKGGLQLRREGMRRKGEGRGEEEMDEEERGGQG